MAKDYGIKTRKELTPWQQQSYNLGSGIDVALGGDLDAQQRAHDLKHSASSIVDSITDPQNNNLSTFVTGLGQWYTNKTNMRIADRQMAFQERMDNTKYQRQAADLEAAGLNRILGYAKGTTGGAPHGASTKIENPVSSALQARRLSQEMRNMRTSEQLLKAQIKKVQADTTKVDLSLPKLNAFAKFWSGGAGGLMGAISQGGSSVAGLLATLGVLGLTRGRINPAKIKSAWKSSKAVKKAKKAGFTKTVRGNPKTGEYEMYD